LRGQEGIAASGVPVMRLHPKHLAKGIKRKAFRDGSSGESPGIIEVECKIHRVERQILQGDIKMLAAGEVQSLHIMANMVPNNHAIAKVIEKELQCLRLIHSVHRFITSDAMHSNG